MRGMEAVATQQSDTTITTETCKIIKKFHTAFTLFAKCHTTMNKTIVTSTEVQELSMSHLQCFHTMFSLVSIDNVLNTVGTDIRHFMAFYKEEFPKTSVIPKMHLLEAHVVPFIKKWGVGCGFLGERGAETVHKYFNLLERTYSSVPDRLARLRQKMVEHHLHSAPTLVESCPKPVAKKRKTE